MHLSPHSHEISYGLIGGLIIGASSTLYLYSSGKMSGMSGFVRNALSANLQDAAYVAGLVTSGVALAHFAPSAFGPEHASHVVTTENGAAIAGLLVGFGSSLGNGCTSGHGVCGLGRRSPRSLAAVCTFMATGAASAFYSRGNTYLFKAAAEHNDLSNLPISSRPIIVAVASSLFLFYVLPNALDVLGGAKIQPPSIVNIVNRLLNYAGAFTCAAVFGAGLGVSGMCNTAKVTSFLDFSHPTTGWDPTLMGVMGGAVVLNLLTFTLYKATHPDSYSLVMGASGGNMYIDWKLITGSALFGMGWGIGGVCPGPALVSLGAGRASALIFLPSMLWGMCLHKGLTLEFISPSLWKKLSAK